MATRGGGSPEREGEVVASVVAESGETLTNRRGSKRHDTIRTMTSRTRLD